MCIDFGVRDGLKVPNIIAYKLILEMLHVDLQIESENESGSVAT
jgi:hypothetical protein